MHAASNEDAALGVWLDHDFTVSRMGHHRKTERVLGMETHRTERGTMNGDVLRVLVADDERPARRFLVNLLKTCPGVELVGEVGTGEEAIALIALQRPDLALLDLQMPELGGLDVVRRLPADVLPLVAFVTAFEDFAIEAFELNAIDHLPVRQRSEVIILPVKQIASIVSEAELLHITTLGRERYTITYRLHLLEVRLDPRRFVRLARGTLANIDCITKISPMPGGTYVATLSNGQELQVSRIQSRVLRETLLKL
jgi:DNA-binding LytR/AlgR family response regulator